MIALSKFYAAGKRAEVHAIDRVDLTASPGEFVSIVGPSGCGKSTLLYIIGGFIDASAGEVRVEGKAISGPGTERGIVFQDFALFPWKTVLGNVTYGLREQGYARRESARRARDYLRMMQLETVERLYPKQLSGGMKQRVALARTLATDPDILLMDEPLGSLDAQTRAVLQVELSDVWERTGKTVLLVTHSVEEAIYLSDRIYVFSQRPARVKAVIDVTIARPRDREAILNDPVYADLHRRIWSLLADEQDLEHHS